MPGSAGTPDTPDGLPDAPIGPAAVPGRGRTPWLWLAAAAVAFPAALGIFWSARDSGAARPLCGDRPGVHYPLCQLPAPWGVGAPPPTTSGFQP